MSNEKSRYHVPNLERALRIMEYLSENPQQANMAEIARQLGYPNNSVFRIVSTLEAEGYLKKDEESKNFSLSRKLLALGYKALVEVNLLEVSADILRQLRDETRETALLGTLLEGEGVVLNQEVSPEPIKFMVSPGTRFNLHTSAPGKAILAFLDEQEQERQISLINFVRYNSRTICSPEAYRNELDKVKQQGFAVDNGEEAESINCVSAPIFDYQGLPKAAIWVTGPEFRLPSKQLQKTGDSVKKYAALLSKRLGAEQDK